MTDAVLTTALADDDVIETPLRRAMRRLFKRRGAVVGLVIIITFIASA